MVNRKLTPEQSKLVESYFPLAMSISREVTKPSGTDEDNWRAECWSALVKAALSHKPGSGNFASYLRRAIESARITLFVNLTRKRRDYRRNVSFSSASLTEEGDRLCIEEDKDKNLKLEEDRQMIARWMRRLNKGQRKIVRLVLKGYTTVEIAAIMGREKPAVYWQYARALGVMREAAMEEGHLCT